MAVSSAYQDAIDLVDATKVLSFLIDPSFEALEWSYAGLEVRGGSDMACGIGAAALLDAMGFRFYTPQPAFWKLPDSIPTSLSAGRRENWLKSVGVFLVYGHSWGGTNGASRSFLNDSYARWADLNAVSSSNNAYPAGHRWVNVINANAGFFDAHPQLLRMQDTVATFDLEGIAGTQDWHLLAELCAGFLLSEGLNEFNRTHFDPVDGDSSASDLVYPFALEVVTRMRSGTGAVGGIPAQAAVPDAQIGLYAYAGHRLPPSQPYRPGVYAQVALAFNQTGLTYLQLIQQHGALADGIMIRDYFDTQVWSGGRPLYNARNKSGYFDDYDGFRAAGVIGVTSEFTANWLVNAIQARAAVLKFRDGVADWAAIIAEFVADIFDGDPAVAELYAYWIDPIERYHKWSLRKSFEIVDQMVPGWYRTYFEQLLTIYYQYHRIDNPGAYGIVRTPDQPEDTFKGEITKLLSWVTALRDDDILHSYAFVRQEANTALNDYPHLKIGSDPEPTWFAVPVAPTHADFVAAMAAILPETERDPALDGSDLVLRMVTPVATPETSPYINLTPATAYASLEGLAVYQVLGPSTVQVQDMTSEETSEIVFGPGLHTLGLAENQRVTWDGGTVFMDTFPFVRKDGDGTERYHWLFVPKTVESAVQIEVDSRWAFYDEDAARKDWGPGLGQDFPELGPGQVAVHNTLTRGKIWNVNCNRYLSPRPDIALMTRTMAQRDGPVSTIKIVEEPPD
ncbi:hypothetical protein [Thalassovita sp.]|uniref:hypothetical protein n=1 Tax=Thalassovita sp. TaxID=1979401 RepID=UPI002B2688D8|nr:hypothetical protein [Thalassovita sp.]